ncbi:MAG: hypothetical protein RLY86_1069 [Pseudomonadota bacterium]|jgi:hypothetical protein
MADAGAPTGTDLPWQHMTASAGLVLAAPVAALDMDPGVLEADLQAVEAAVPVADRSHVPHMPGWACIPMVTTDSRGRVVENPAFARMPAVRARLADLGLTVTGSFVIRHAAGWTLDWHYDPVAPHRGTARLILPLRTTPGSATWIGHERHAWPVGRCWAGDFTVPHKVTVDPAQDRIVLTLDIAMDAAAQAIIPAILAADGQARAALAQDTQNALLLYRQAA